MGELLSGIVGRLHEAVGLLMGEGDDGERHRHVGNGRTTGASVVLDVDVELVVVSDVMRVSCRGEVGEEEHLFGGSGAGPLGPHRRDSVLDHVQVEGHDLRHWLGVLGRNALLVLVLDDVELFIEGVVA